MRLFSPGNRYLRIWLVTFVACGLAVYIATSTFTPYWQPPGKADANDLLAALGYALLLVSSGVLATPIMFALLAFSDLDRFRSRLKDIRHLADLTITSITESKSANLELNYCDRNYNSKPPEDMMNKLIGNPRIGLFVSDAKFNSWFQKTRIAAKMANKIIDPPHEVAKADNNLMELAAEIKAVHAITRTWFFRNVRFILAAAIVLSGVSIFAFREFSIYYARFELGIFEPINSEGQIEGRVTEDDFKYTFFIHEAAKAVFLDVVDIFDRPIPAFESSTVKVKEGGKTSAVFKSYVLIYRTILTMLILPALLFAVRTFYLYGTDEEIRCRTVLPDRSKTRASGVLSPQPT